MLDWACGGLGPKGWIRGVCGLDLVLGFNKDPFGFISRNHKDQSYNYPIFKGLGLASFQRYISD